MADYTTRTETFSRVVFALPQPTNWVEVEKVLAACRDYLATSRTYDDSVIVEADDEEIGFVIIEKG